MFKGDKPVVIDFWATWCGPCMRLIPEMEKMAEKYKDQVIFLKVNADKEKELCSSLTWWRCRHCFLSRWEANRLLKPGLCPKNTSKLLKTSC